MGILAVTHPGIEGFITLKSDMRTLTNFNISVAVTEEFMRAVQEDREYELINPRSGEPPLPYEPGTLGSLTLARFVKPARPGGSPRTGARLGPPKPGLSGAEG